MKKCSRCGINKSLEEFSTYRGSGKTYIRNRCKLCEKERLSQYRTDNKEKVKATWDKYYQIKKDEILEGSRKYKATLNPKMLSQGEYQSNSKYQIQS